MYKAVKPIVSRRVCQDMWFLAYFKDWYGHVMTDTEKFVSETKLLCYLHEISLECMENEMPMISKSKIRKTVANRCHVLDFLEFCFHSDALRFHYRKQMFVNWSQHKPVSLGFCDDNQKLGTICYLSYPSTFRQQRTKQPKEWPEIWVRPSSTIYQHRFDMKNSYDS